MSTQLVRRPTEQAAVGRAMKSARPFPPIGVAFAGLVLAERAGDLHGALLCRCLVQRVARDGQVGE